jgi:hypothetical protein
LAGVYSAIAATASTDSISTMLVAIAGAIVTLGLSRHQRPLGLDDEADAAVGRGSVPLGSQPNKLKIAPWSLE